MHRPLDDADLICIAAIAADVDPDYVCDRTDVAELARVVAALETTTSPTEAAAAVLVEIARRRPFPRANAATAWLAAAHVLATNRLMVRISDSDVRGLIDGARDGLVSRKEATDLLRFHVRQRPRGVDRWLRVLFLPPPQRPATWPCPLCARPVAVRGSDTVWMKAPDAPDARAVLIALCRRAHQTHRRPERRQPRNKLPVGSALRRPTRDLVASNS